MEKHIYNIVLMIFCGAFFVTQNGLCANARDNISNSVAGETTQQLQGMNLFGPLKAEKIIKSDNIPEIVFEIVREVDDPGIEITKYYTMRLPSGWIQGPVLVIVKLLNNSFLDFPLYVGNDGFVKGNDTVSNYLWGTSAGYGESLEVLIVPTLPGGSITKGVKPLGKGTFIPFPLIVKDDQGHSIEVVAIGAEGHYFTVMGKGFTSKERIFSLSRSSDEVLSYFIDADENGNVQMGFAPAVIGEREGQFSITFRTEKMAPLTLNHYWGRIAFSTPKEYKALADKFPKSKAEP